MKVGPLRLQLGADLRRVLEVWFAEQQEQAGCVISAVGSLQVAQLRFAGATGGHGDPRRAGNHQPLRHPFSRWRLRHLCAGSLVRTPAELVIGLLTEWQFSRKLDLATGSAELQINAQPKW